MSPRWFHLLKDALAAENSPTIVYTLATIDHNEPSARTVVHRGIFTHSPSCPLLYTNTDVRSPKVHQLHASPASQAVFYFPATDSQMRITARTYALPPPSHPWRDDFPAQHLSAGMPIDWDQHRLHAFHAISPVRRASFASPAVPGSSLLPQLPPPPSCLEQEAKTEEERQLIQRAFDNFALVILEPLAVDYLQLPSPTRRTAWKRLDNGEWEESAIAP